MPHLLEKTIVVGGRASPLAQIQVQEILDELRKHHPEIDFELQTFETYGDKDLNTSLRTLDKTDFFTKEIDAALIQGDCRIAIHSAKDLPDPLPNGLSIIALTAGLDPADSLVMAEGMTLQTLPPKALIATSSERRESIVKQLRQDLTFTDIRGTIEMRLHQLEIGKIQGLVVAEAALIRLNLTHLNRIKLPGKTAPLQGKLAVLACTKDDEMKELFSCIDTRKRCLYLGLELPKGMHEMVLTHFPVIETIPRLPSDPAVSSSFAQFDQATHVILTSKTAVRAFFDLLPHFGKNWKDKIFISVGQSTTETLKQFGVQNILTAPFETQEGIIKLLDLQNLSCAHIFWPHSSLTRGILGTYLKFKGIAHTSFVLYDTHPVKHPKPPQISSFDCLYFTSPSTIDAFIQIYGKIPQDKELIAIGPITEEALSLKLAFN